MAVAADEKLDAHSGLEKAIGVFLEYLEKERNYARYTLDAYRRDLQQFARYLYPRMADVRLPLALLQQEVIRSFLEELEEKGLKPSSICRKLAAIRSFFRFLCREGILPGNPASGISAPQFQRSLPGTLNLGQIEEAIELPASGEFAGARDRAIIEVFYGGGIRLGELVQLNLSALDMGEGTARVVGKGKKERIVPVGSMALQVLEEYLKQRAQLLLDLDITQVDAGALFLNEQGRRLHQRTVQRLVKRYLSKVAEDGQLSPHLLRHTFASHLLEAGADLRAVKDLLGHATLASTHIYTQVSLDRLRSIYEQAHPRS